MRTHLLRTFYPPATTESETDVAANDAEYGMSLEADFRIARANAEAAANAARLSREDEYALGGYAGI